jgi:hypothetical protein
MNRWIKIVIGVLLFSTIAIFGFGQAVHYLWNWLMPKLFGLPVVTFWQAVGLLALSWLLFGGWRGARGYSPRSRGFLRRRMMERWAKMTPEERARFREGWRTRCGPFPSETQSNP